MRYIKYFILYIIFLLTKPITKLTLDEIESTSQTLSYLKIKKMKNGYETFKSL